MPWATLRYCTSGGGVGFSLCFYVCSGLVLSYHLVIAIDYIGGVCLRLIPWYLFCCAAPTD